MSFTARLAQAMAAYDAGSPMRVQHFMKVYAFSKFIGESEGLGEEAQEILEAAALTHDIGIRKSLGKYQSAAGHYQELEGPPEARALLGALGAGEALIERVCYLVAHHHTYTDISGLDYQILVEADFLVNIYEGEMQAQEIRSVREKIFKTQAGLNFLDLLYPAE